MVEIFHAYFCVLVKMFHFVNVNKSGMWNLKAKKLPEIYKNSKNILYKRKNVEYKFLHVLSLDWHSV